jgi:predicted dehydrogenase
MEYTGGEITNWGVHHVDIAQWALGCENCGPVQIKGTGEFPFGRELMRDILMGKESPAKLPNSFNTPRKFNVTLTFSNGNKLIVCDGSNGILIEGEKGRVFVNRGKLTGKPIEDLSPNDTEWLDQGVLKSYRGRQPGNHMQDFFTSLKDRSLPISDVFTHLNSVNSCHLANIAILTGRRLPWDSERETFLGDDEACRLLNRPQRKPFTVQ